jgi:hypothetical protein
MTSTTQQTNDLCELRLRISLSAFFFCVDDGRSSPSLSEETFTAPPLELWLMWGFAARSALPDEKTANINVCLSVRHVHFSKVKHFFKLFFRGSTFLSNYFSFWDFYITIDLGLVRGAPAKAAGKRAAARHLAGAGAASGLGHAFDSDPGDDYNSNLGGNDANLGGGDQHCGVDVHDGQQRTGFHRATSAAFASRSGSRGRCSSRAICLWHPRLPLQARVR